MALVTVGENRMKPYQMENKKIKYNVYCCIPGISTEEIIECREMTIKEGAYTFWEGEYGETNKIIASFPIAFTIITRVDENEQNITKCPLCGEEMNGIKLTHYKCKNCNEYYTN